MLGAGPLRTTERNFGYSGWTPAEVHLVYRRARTRNKPLRRTDMAGGFSGVVMDGSDDLVEPEGVNAGSAEPESDAPQHPTLDAAPQDGAQTAAPVETDDDATRAARAMAPGQESEVGEG